MNAGLFFKQYTFKLIKNYKAMTDSRKSYHKNASFLGLIFVGGEEYGMHVRNLSISGMLVEIDISAESVDEQGVLASLKEANLIDFYIEQLKLQGEAKITRVEIDGQHILIGLEFKQIAYDTESFLNQRYAYRKMTHSLGHILIAKKVYEFSAQNVSVEGLMARIPQHVVVSDGTLVKFKFNDLCLHGEVSVVWSEYDEQNGTLLGLKYEHMKKTELKDIPQFYHHDE